MIKKIVSLNKDKIESEAIMIANRLFPRGDEFFAIISNAVIRDGYLVFECHGMTTDLEEYQDQLYVIRDDVVISEPLDIVESFRQGDRLFIKTYIPQNMRDGKIGINPRVERLVLSTNGNIVQSPRHLRASYNKESVIVYQAYRSDIAQQAIDQQRFGDKFDFQRSMSWIKPSFFWMMHRTKWLKKDPDQRILRIRISREFLHYMLDKAVLTKEPDNNYYGSQSAYKKALAKSYVRVQWDPERSMKTRREATQRAIQIGIGKRYYHQYNDNIISIEDITPLCGALHERINRGENILLSQDVLPEYVYPIPEEIMRKLDMID